MEKRTSWEKHDLDRARAAVMAGERRSAEAARERVQEMADSIREDPELFRPLLLDLLSAGFADITLAILREAGKR